MSHTGDIDNRELLQWLRLEAMRPFSGWDFSYISGTGCMVEAPLTWNYASKIIERLRRSNSVLDMGTGGGEFLSRLAPLPERTHATEAHRPNVAVARERLEPLGATLHELANEDDDLPFDDEQFDLVINRHEAYTASEVKRVLRPSSHFITQQAGNKDDAYLRDLPGCEQPVDKPWDLSVAVRELADHGFEILEQKECSYITRFFDVGAIVYYLTAIPWIVPDFDVETYIDSLVKLHEMVRQHGYIDVDSSRFFVAARKP